MRLLVAVGRAPNVEGLGLETGDVKFSKKGVQVDDHLRTTNPIESTFATVRLRHKKTKGNGSRKACLAMVFKLCESAQKRWRRLNAHELIQDVIANVTFTDGEKQQAA